MINLIKFFLKTNIKNRISCNTNDNIQSNINFQNSNYYKNQPLNNYFDRNKVISSFIDKKFTFNKRRSAKDLHIDNQNFFNINSFNRINLSRSKNHFSFENNNNNNNNGNIDYLNSNILHKITKNYKYNNKRSFNFKKHNRSPSDDYNSFNKSKFRKINFNSKIIASLDKYVPQSYYQATHCSDSQLWIQAIKDEVNNLYNNKTMTFVKQLLVGKKAISSRWVFANKSDGLGNVIKHKVRFVAKGFSQKFGIAYELTFSPTFNIDCMKLIIALAAKFHWTILQLDIKAAYLNADLDKDIYVSIPHRDPNFERGYWQLNKALYGLKQSGRQWYKTISKFLKKQGLERLKYENFVFKKVINNKVVCIIGLCVDDMCKDMINIFSTLINLFCTLNYLM